MGETNLESNMSKARITFMVPHAPASLAECLANDGWSFGAGAPCDAPGLARYLSERVGTSVTASFGGTFPRMAVDAAAASLSEAEADYVAVVAGGIDPAMDAPAPAWVDVGLSWHAEGRSMRLPRGFLNPAIDVRTLVAAGMDAADASACVAAVTGGAGSRPVGAVARSAA